MGYRVPSVQCLYRRRPDRSGAGVGGGRPIESLRLPIDPYTRQDNTRGDGDGNPVGGDDDNTVGDDDGNPVGGDDDNTSGVHGDLNNSRPDETLIGYLAQDASGVWLFTLKDVDRTYIIGRVNEEDQSGDYEIIDNSDVRLDASSAGCYRITVTDRQSDGVYAYEVAHNNGFKRLSESC